MSNEVNIKVRLKVGSIEVELECPQKELEKTIKNVVSAIKNNIGEQIPIEKAPIEKEMRIETIQKRKTFDNLTCRDLIEKIYEEGWFSEERSLSNVVEEIARRGYNYNSTAVSHVLLDLVRQRILERRGKPRKYRYIATSKKEENIISKEIEKDKKIKELNIDSYSLS